METFSRAEIDAARRRHEEAGHPSFPVEYKGKMYSAFVIPQEKGPPELPDFVQRFTGERPEDGTVFAISSSVREFFRRFPIIHEIIEFTEVGIRTVDRCAKAARREIDLVRLAPELSPADIRAYITMRCNFFRNLVAFTANRPGYTDEDNAEFRAALAVFEQEVRTFERGPAQ